MVPPHIVNTAVPGWPWVAGEESGARALDRVGRGASGGAPGRDAVGDGGGGGLGEEAGQANLAPHERVLPGASVTTTAAGDDGAEVVRRFRGAAERDDYIRTCFEPLFKSPFRITRAYAGSLVEGMKEMGKLSLRTPEPEQFEMPHDMVFMNRVQFGLYSVLARLDVEVDYAQLERDFWSEVETSNRGTPDT